MTTTELIALVVAVVAVLLAATASVVALQVRSLVRQRSLDRSAEPLDAEPEDRPRAAIVVNPSKVRDMAPVRAALERACSDLGWHEPLWLETTPEDNGGGQARQALDEGVDVVAAFGGDGTVRAVAEVLAGTGTAMGLVPAGTGNLLARNLDVVTSRAAEIAADDAEAAMRVVLTGDDRPIDIGWASLEGGADGGDGDGDGGGDGAADGREHAFLVMAGMGFDAEIMANAPEALKAKVGPIAYVVSGLQRFQGDRVRLTIDVDGTEHHRGVRTVVIGNVGRLQGGLTLMPDAEVDDGWLDVVAIGPRGIVGWLDVAGRIITRRTRRDQRLAHWRGRRIDLVAEKALPAQLDGDPVGDARALRVRVAERALLVRVAAGAPARPHGPGGQLRTRLAAVAAEVTGR